MKNNLFNSAIIRTPPKYLYVYYTTRRINCEYLEKRKIELTVDNGHEKGKLTVEEGKELTEELKKTIQSKKEDLMPLTKEDLREILNEMSFASKEDLYEVKERLNRIEDTFDQLEKEKFEE